MVAARPVLTCTTTLTHAGTTAAWAAWQHTDAKAFQVELGLVAVLVPFPEAVRYSWDVVTGIGLARDVDIVVLQLRVSIKEVEHEVQHVVSHTCTLNGPMFRTPCAGFI
jgi:hypothetical protein